MMPSTGAICGCSLLLDTLKKHNVKRICDLPEEESEMLRDYLFNPEHPCYWCEYDLE